MGSFLSHPHAFFWLNPEVEHICFDSSEEVFYRTEELQVAIQHDTWIIILYI